MKSFSWNEGTFTKVDRFERVFHPFHYVVDPRCFWISVEKTALAVDPPVLYKCAIATEGG